MAALITGMIAAVSSCEKVDNTYKDYQKNAGVFNGNTLTYLQAQNGVFDSLLLALNRLPELKQKVQNDTVTLFAPTNESFKLVLNNINQARKDLIPAKAPVSISTINLEVLDTFLSRYMLIDKRTTANVTNFTDGLPFPAVKYNYEMHIQLQQTSASGFLNGGPKILIFSDPKKSVFVRNWIRVETTTVDIKTNNGIVHILSTGHDFGFGVEFVRAVNRF